MKKKLMKLNEKKLDEVNKWKKFNEAKIECMNWSSVFI